YVFGRQCKRGDGFATRHRGEAIVMRKGEQRRRMQRERHAGGSRLTRKCFNGERRRDEIGVRIDQADARRAHDDVCSSGILRQLAPQRLRLLLPRVLDVVELEIHAVYGLRSTVCGPSAKKSPSQAAVAPSTIPNWEAVSLPNARINFACGIVTRLCASNTPARKKGTDTLASNRVPRMLVVWGI